MSTLSQFFGGGAGGNSGGGGTSYSQNQNVKEHGDGELVLYEYQPHCTFTTPTSQSQVNDITFTSNSCYLAFATVNSGMPKDNACQASASGAVGYAEFSGNTSFNCLNTSIFRCDRGSCATLYHSDCCCSIVGISTCGCCSIRPRTDDSFCVRSITNLNINCSFSESANGGAVYSFSGANTNANLAQGFSQCCRELAGVSPYGIGAPTLVSGQYRNSCQCCPTNASQQDAIGYVYPHTPGLSNISLAQQNSEKVLIDSGLELLPSYLGGNYLISANSVGQYSKLKTLFSPVGSSMGQPGAPGGFLGAGAVYTCRCNRGSCTGQTYGSGAPVSGNMACTQGYPGLAGIEYWNCT